MTKPWYPSLLSQYYPRAFQSHRYTLPTLLGHRTKSRIITLGLARYGIIPASYDISRPSPEYKNWGRFPYPLYFHGSTRFLHRLYTKMKFSVLASLLGGAANLATASWYSDIDHTSAVRGYAPDLDGDYNYPVYKAVTPGDGAGIQSAINAGTLPNTQRHGQWFASQPRVCPTPIDEMQKRRDINMRS